MSSTLQTLPPFFTVGGSSDTDERSRESGDLSGGAGESSNDSVSDGSEGGVGCGPVPDEQLLQHIHPMPQDATIVFEPEAHTYDVEGVRARCSVTRLLSLFAGNAPAALPGEKKRATVYAGLSDAEIYARYDEIRDAAAKLGTACHAEAERCINRIAVGRPMGVTTDPYIMGQMCHFYLFVQDFFREKGEQHGMAVPLQPYRTEISVATPLPFPIAGQIDFLGKDRDGEWVLLDWKWSRKINTSGYMGLSLLGPFRHMQDCNAEKYSLQLCIYAEILRRHCGIDVPLRNMAFLCFWRNLEPTPSGRARPQGSYRLYHCRDRLTEAAYLLDMAPATISAMVALLEQKDIFALNTMAQQQPPLRRQCAPPPVAAEAADEPREWGRGARRERG